MMGESEGQSTFYYNMSIEQFVPQDHPLRAITWLIGWVLNLKRMAKLLIAQPAQA